MTNVSKNIKRLRNARKLTQDSLGEKLHLTRQAISSWELGRTQPDLEMLMKLAEVFEVSIEELLYGEKRNTKIDNENKPRWDSAIIIFAILGSLLVIAGLVLIIVNFWDNIPEFVKRVFAYAPLLLGQGAGVYTFLKKRNVPAFCEGAGVLWTIGVVATVLFTANSNSIPLPFADSLLPLICLVLIVPILFLLPSVSALTGYYVLCNVWAVFFAEEFMQGKGFVLSVLIYLACILPNVLGVWYMLKSKAWFDKGRHIYSQWISAASCTFSAVWLFFGFHFDDGIFLGLLLWFATYYALSKKDDSPFSPLYFIGIVGMSVCNILTIFTTPNDGESLIFGLLVFLVLLAIACFIERKSFEDNILKISIIGASVLNFAASVVISFGNSFVDVNYFAMLVTFVYAALLVLNGAKLNSMFVLNLGLITACVIVIYLFVLLESSLLLGVATLLLGVGLLYVNKQFLNRQKQLAERAVSENEEQ